MAYSASNQKGGRMITALFHDREHAERAYDAVIDRGYRREDVSVLMSAETRKRHFGEERRETEFGNKALEGAGAGAAIGGTLGGIAGALAAIGTSVAIPGLGLVIAGPLAAALAGAGAGGAAGTLVGALIGAGIPEERVKRYQSGIEEGGIVLGVEPRTPEDADYIEREWKRLGGEHVYRAAEAYR